MTAHDVQIEVIEPMQRVFQPPWKMSEQEQKNALREYVAALQAFEATDLNTAWCSVRDSQTTRGWPVPAAFVMAARAARKYRAETEGKPSKTGKSGAEENHWETWKAASRTAKAREAVKLGVAWGFKCAVLHDGKDPATVDLIELRQSKNSAERTADAIQKGRPIRHNGREIEFSDDQANLALQLWRNLLVNEEQTQSEIVRVAA